MVQKFGTLQDGTEVSLITIENKKGMRLSMTELKKTLEEEIKPLIVVA